MELADVLWFLGWKSMGIVALLAFVVFCVWLMLSLVQMLMDDQDDPFDDDGEG